MKMGKVETSSAVGETPCASTDGATETSELLQVMSTELVQPGSERETELSDVHVVWVACRPPTAATGDVLLAPKFWPNSERILSPVVGPVAGRIEEILGAS